jgi:ABC-2 type transport system permease protein
MPVHDVGYRRWEGQRTHYLTRIFLIAVVGIRLAARSAWVRRTIMFAWLPVIWWGVGFFALEQTSVSNNRPDWSESPLDFGEVASRAQRRIGDEGASAILQRLRIPQTDRLTQRLAGRQDNETRNIIWNWMLMTFFRYPQALLILFLIGATTPALISRDIRSRAFLLYFSRPIGSLEYIAGKLLVPASYILFVTTLPALALYLFAIAMSPDLTVIGSTWEIPLKILIASLALVIPTSLLALMLSSLTQESRFANFSWFAIWALGHGAWFAVLLVVAVQLDTQPFDPLVLNNPTVLNWSVLSLYNNLGDVQSWIFGFRSFQEIWRGFLALLLVSLFSLVMLHRHVSAPIRV